MQKRLFLILVSSFLLGLFILPFSVEAFNTEDCLNKTPSSLQGEEIDQCGQFLKDYYDKLASAQATNKNDLALLQKQLSNLNARVNSLINQLKINDQSVRDREKKLAYTQEIFEEKTNNYYKFMRLYDPIMPFLSANDASEAFREINLRQKAADEDRKTMEQYVNDIKKLREDKILLEKNRDSYDTLQKQVSEKEKFLAGEVAKTDNFLNTLSKRQNELLAAKSGSFIASVGDSDLADDYNASIKGFRESAPSGSFAVFSFGAYTHRKGMSQYGARGRAENGQSSTQILKAYYGKEPINKDTGGTISVSGYGSLDFESYYLMGIAEMPSSWHIEALKAQAIAARTYAYRYKIENKTICIDEGCQVFKKSKADNPPELWRQAVTQTRGQVLEDVTTFYSSTSGGYLTTSGWDTTDGGGGSNFLDKAYEKIGGSPWVYKAWYRKGYSSSGDSCGQNDPWLTNEELTDVINAAIVLKRGGDDRVSSTSTSCWGGNPYSISELRQKGGLDSISSISVTQGSGTTNSVIINGNITLSGDEFKQAFNLRAPGYLMIPQKGFAFFNIEKK